MAIARVAAMTIPPMTPPSTHSFSLSTSSRESNVLELRPNSAHVAFDAPEANAENLFGRHSDEITT